MDVGHIGPAYGKLRFGRRQAAFGKPGCCGLSVLLAPPSIYFQPHTLTLCRMRHRFPPPQELKMQEDELVGVQWMPLDEVSWWWCVRGCVDVWVRGVGGGVAGRGEVVFGQ